MTSTVRQKLNVDLLRRQDPAEFTSFVRFYQTMVFGLGQSLGLSGTDCDDLAAESFAIAYRALPVFRGEADVATWLYRIAYRTALKVRRRYPSSPSLGEETPDLSEPSPSQASETNETNSTVWRAVARLDPEQAMAVELFYRRGMSLEEIADVMEKPLGTVKTLLFRGRERLRMLLKSLEKAL